MSGGLVIRKLRHKSGGRCRVLARHSERKPSVHLDGDSTWTITCNLMHCLTGCKMMEIGETWHQLEIAHPTIRSG
jgi:hypothetical protein